MHYADEIRYRMNYNGQDWPVFRANLNAHTTLSDGQFTPNDTYNGLYGDDGAIALNDPGLPPPFAESPDPRITIIPTIEWVVPGPRNTSIHLLAYGVPQDVKTNPASMQEALAIAKEVGALVYVAHPHLSGLHARELLEMGHFDGVEFYNAEARKNGKEFSLITWDNLLDGGREDCGGIATDGFRFLDSFRMAWTMICAPDKSVKSLLDAIRARRFYCTQGPTFSRIEYKNRHFRAEFSSAVEVILIGNSPHVPERFNAVPVRCKGTYWPGVDPSESCLVDGPEIEDPCTNFDVDLTSWSDTGYVRCQIRDKNGHYAWTQAFSL